MLKFKKKMTPIYLSIHIMNFDELSTTNSSPQFEKKKKIISDGIWTTNQWTRGPRALYHWAFYLLMTGHKIKVSQKPMSLFSTSLHSPYGLSTILNKKIVKTWQTLRRNIIEGKPYFEKQTHKQNKNNNKIKTNKKANFVALQNGFYFSGYLFYCDRISPTPSIVYQNRL